jgi:alanine transaminase
MPGATEVRQNGHKVAQSQHDINVLVNAGLRRAEYAVRGKITERAAEIEKALAEGSEQFDFDKVLYCNIGNPQALGQQPVSYPRRLLACCECPEVC